MKPDLGLTTAAVPSLVLGGTRSSAPHPPPTLPQVPGTPTRSDPPLDVQPYECGSPCPCPAEEGDPAEEAPEWRTLASHGRRPTCRGVPSAGLRRPAMRSTLPGSAIPPSRSPKGPKRRLTSARESGFRGAPEGTPETRGRLRVLRWTLGTGQSPPIRWAGPLPVATAGIPVVARKGPRSRSVPGRLPPRWGPLGTGRLTTALFRELPRCYWTRPQGGLETGPPLVGRSSVTQSGVQRANFKELGRVRWEGQSVYESGFFPSGKFGSVLQRLFWLLITDL